MAVPRAETGGVEGRGASAVVNNGGREMSSIVWFEVCSPRQGGAAVVSDGRAVVRLPVPFEVAPPRRRARL